MIITNDNKRRKIINLVQFHDTRMIIIIIIKHLLMQTRTAPVFAILQTLANPYLSLAEGHKSHDAQETR